MEQHSNNGTESNGLFKQSGTAEKTGCVAVLREIAISAFPVFCSQHLKISGLSQCLTSHGPHRTSLVCTQYIRTTL